MAEARNPNTTAKTLVTLAGEEKKAAELAASPISEKNPAEIQVETQGNLAFYPDTYMPNRLLKKFPEILEPTGFFGKGTLGTLKSEWKSYGQSKTPFERYDAIIKLSAAIKSAIADPKNKDKMDKMDKLYDLDTAVTKEKMNIELYSEYFSACKRNEAKEVIREWANYHKASNSVDKIIVLDKLNKAILETLKSKLKKDDRKILTNFQTYIQNLHTNLLKQKSEKNEELKNLNTSHPNFIKRSTEAFEQLCKLKSNLSLTNPEENKLYMEKTQRQIDSLANLIAAGSESKLRTLEEDQGKILGELGRSISKILDLVKESESLLSDKLVTRFKQIKDSINDKTNQINSNLGGEIQLVNDDNPESYVRRKNN